VRAKHLSISPLGLDKNDAEPGEIGDLTVFAMVSFADCSTFDV
jgi:hypothetical protein